jgi:hypothetical protein
MVEDGQEGRCGWSMELWIELLLFACTSCSCVEIAQAKDCDLNQFAAKTAPFRPFVSFLAPSAVLYLQFKITMLANYSQISKNPSFWRAETWRHMYKRNVAAAGVVCVLRRVVEGACREIWWKGV